MNREALLTRVLVVLEVVSLVFLAGCGVPGVTASFQDSCQLSLYPPMPHVELPYAELFHHESVSRGFGLDWREVEFMKRRWGRALLNDPDYTRNLSLESGNFGIRI